MKTYKGICLSNRINEFVNIKSQGYFKVKLNLEAMKTESLIFYENGGTNKKYLRGGRHRNKTGCNWWVVLDEAYIAYERESVLVLFVFRRTQAVCMTTDKNIIIINERDLAFNTKSYFL